MKAAFFIAVFLSLFSYSIYPLALLLSVRFRSRPWTRSEVTPTISVLISAFNEAAIIEKKVRNAISSDYPAADLEVAVASDGSTDRTNEIVTSLGVRNVSLYAFPRQGKTACLNNVMPMLRGEIVVFTDANAMFPRELMRRLVRNFADPEVGLVTGWTRYEEAGDRHHAEPIGIYAKLERMIKILESRIDSCVGADGAVFAIRRELFRPLSDNDINDFVLPLDVVRQGKRVVMDPEVVCIEPSPSSSLAAEYHRQVRITTRTLGAICRNRRFLSPIRHGWFSIFLWSHKVIRFVAPIFMLAAFLINTMLVGESSFYMATMMIQFVLLVIAGCGFLGIRLGGISSAACTFLVTAAAQLVALGRTIAGSTDTIWTPQR